MSTNIIKLTDTQKEVLEVVKNQKTYGVFLDMGVGKTALILSLLDYLIFDKLEDINALIVVPAQVGKVFQVWQKEIQKWENFKYIDFNLIEGTPEKRKKIIKKNNSSVTLISNNLVGWLYDNDDNFDKYNVIIIDESSEYKTHTTNRFKQMSRILKDQRVYLLSGTPTSKSWLDIWSQIYLLDKGKRLGANYYHFRNKYFYEYKQYRWAMKEGAKKNIIEAIKDIACFSSGEQKLPELKIIPTYLKFSDDKQKIFNYMKKNFVMEWEGQEITALSTATMINKCLQLSNGMIYQQSGEYLHFDDTKLNWLKDFNSSTDENILVFYIYVFDKERILKLDGAREIKTVQDVDDWNAGKIKLGILSPYSMKFGGNLQQGGHIIVWFGLTWDLLQLLQSNKRIWRRGQQHEVRIYYLMMAQTYDNYVYRNIYEKNLSHEEFLNSIRIKKE